VHAVIDPTSTPGEERHREPGRALGSLWGGGHQFAAPERMVPWYIGTIMTTYQATFLVERVQTGVRMERRILKVLKGFAEYHDMTLGDLLEGIVLHAFDGKTPFSAASLARIQELKKFYGLNLDSGASHHLTEVRGRVAAGPAKKRRKS
jgi:hypothetical protein